MSRLAGATVILASIAVAVTGCTGTASHPRKTAVARPPAPPRLAPAPTPTLVSAPTPTTLTTPRRIPPPSLAHAPTARTPAGGTAAAPASRAPTTATGIRYAFPVVGCRVSYGRTHHDYPATDIFAARGCAVVAPVTGRIDEVSSIDRWEPRANAGAARGGLSISIVGADGVRYYGSHLSAVAIGARPGQLVHVGQLIGRVGNSGDARGVATHLHFGISWPTPPANLVGASR